MSDKHLRPAKTEDIEAIRTFLSERNPSPVFIKQLESRLDMWWKNNPAMADEIPPGWILEDSRAEIVGFIANVPVPYQICGKKDTAVASSSWYVKPEARGMISLGLLKSFLAQKDKKLFIANQPEGNVPKILTRLGLLHASLPHGGVEYLHLLRPDLVFLLFLCRMLKFSPVYTLLKGLTYPLRLFSPLFSLARKIRKPPFEKPGSSSGRDEYVCSLVGRCAQSFTRLWEEHKKKNQITLYRDSETLNWLYFSEAVADQRRVIQCVSKKDRKLAGYVVFDIIRFPRIGVKIFRLVDVYIPDPNEHILASLMSFAAEQAKKEKTAALRMWARDQNMERFLREWFKIRRKYDFLYHYKLTIPEGIPADTFAPCEFLPSPIDPERGTVAFYSSLYF